MKIAISLPDPILREADRHARRTGKSRSQLCSAALAEYLIRHDPDAVTEAMNHVCDDVDTRPDPFLRAAGHHILGIGLIPGK